MTTRSAKAMLSWLNLTDESVGVIVANDGQEIIPIDDVAQLNEDSVEGLCWVPRSLEKTKGGVYNPGVALSEITEANLQVIIYYIKNVKRIGRTCTHADVYIVKICAMYHK